MHCISVFPFLLILSFCSISFYPIDSPLKIAPPYSQCYKPAVLYKQSGWKGEFLEYSNGYNPWQVAIDVLCDPWSEWDGMREIVAEMRE